MAVRDPFEEFEEYLDRQRDPFAEIDLGLRKYERMVGWLALVAALLTAILAGVVFYKVAMRDVPPHRPAPETPPAYIVPAL